MASSIRVFFVVESGTDVRIVEKLRERVNLTLLARKIPGGVEVSQPISNFPSLYVFPSSRIRSAASIFLHLWRERAAVDVAVVQGYGLAALATNFWGILAKKPVLMLVCSPVEDYYLCRLTPGSKKKFRKWELAGLRIVARVNSMIGGNYVVLSEYLAHVVKQHGRPRQCAVVPIYGVDTDHFAPAKESKSVLRARMNLPSEANIMFFSSRIAPEKDAETLLQAFRLLFDRGRNIWLLHRSGGYREFIQAAEKFGVKDRVLAGEAVNPVGELAMNYQASDLCIQASRQEGLGFSPLEALACEVPVVAAAVGGLKETIVDGATGWTYPVGDAEQLAKCIEDVLDRPDEAARRSREGRKMVCSRYDQRFVFDRFVNLIETIVARGSW